MQEEVELCKDLCPEDCVYRALLNGSDTPICYYAVITNKPSRGCKISECDKYISGAKTQPRMKPEFWIEWEYEIYGTSEDDNPIW